MYIPAFLRSILPSRWLLVHISKASSIPWKAQCQPFEAIANIKCANRVSPATQVTPSPSLLIKAYALMLKSKMTFDPDLSDSGKAIFIATMQQKGLPIGVPEPCINEQLYQHANATQIDDDINFESGRGDYFAYLSRYLTHATTFSRSSSEVDNTHKKYLAARQTVDQEYRVLRQSFDLILLQNSNYKWLDHARSPRGQRYRDAWEDRDQAASELPTKDLEHLLQLADSAQARVEPRLVQNMPSLQLDGDMISVNKEVDPRNIIYRPLHYLSGFAADSRVWRDQYNIDIRRPKSLEISLHKAMTKSWASLGFPQFDKTDSGADQADSDLLAEWRICLTYTRMASYTVYRGLWDVPNFRELLPTIGSQAPGSLSRKINKTTALLLAYGVQLSVLIPKNMVDSRTARDVMLKVTDGIALDRVSSREFRTPDPTNDAYPNLLAVMTQKT